MNQLVDLSLITNILAIILSIVALVITVIGFFASLKFYRDGVRLQNTANDALVKLEEKTHSIQSQVGGMFEKTLDAAISKSTQLDTTFDQLNDQLVSTKQNILDATSNELGRLGKEEQNKLMAVVEKQLRSIEEKVMDTKISAESIAIGDAQIYLTMSELQANIVEVLFNSPEELTSAQLSENINKPLIDIKRSIEKLVRRGTINVRFTKNHRYYSVKRDQSKET